MRGVHAKAVLALVVLTGSMLAALPAQAADPRTEALQQQLRDDEAACRQRFAVNDCIAQARRRHREAMAPLQAQAREQAEAQGRQRAEQRQAQIDARRGQGADRAAARAAATASGAASTDSAGSAAPAASVAPRPAPPGPTAAARATEAQQKAAERAAAAERLQAQIKDDQARIAERVRRREVKAKKATPLPAGRAASAASAAPG